MGENRKPGGLQSGGVGLPLIVDPTGVSAVLKDFVSLSNG